MTQQTLSNAIDSKQLWAFAIDINRPVSSKRRRRLPAPQRNLQHYVVTACSPLAKTFGVKAGMRFSEAKALVPNVRVIVCNR